MFSLLICCEVFAVVSEDLLDFRIRFRFLDSMYVSVENLVSGGVD